MDFDGLCVYLDSLNHAIGQLDGGNQRGRGEGRGTPLDASDDPAVFPVLLHR